MTRTLAVLIVGCALALPAAASSATYTVNDPVDTGPLADCDADPANCSLREAVNSANGIAGPDTIVVATAAYPLANGPLPVASEMTIQAAGPGRPEIDGQGLARILQATAPLVLEGLDLVDGFDGGVGAAGGAIESTSDLSLDDVVITHSVADGSSAARGGAISTTGATLSVVDSRFEDNTATSAIAAQGGAIGVAGGASVTIVDTVFAGNRADGDSGAVGGAVHTDGPATLTRVTLSGNAAESLAGSARGGAVSISGAPLHLVDSTVRNNVARTEAAQVASGGGIQAAGDDLTIVGSELEDNDATSAGGTAAGGAISHAGGPGDTAAITTSTLRDNMAAGGEAFGAGVHAANVGVSLVQSTLAANTASATVTQARGGGLMLTGETLIATNSTLFGNAVIPAVGAQASGGGVFSDTPGSTLTATTVTANQAIGAGTPTGGGLAGAGAATTFLISGSIVSGNDQPTSTADCADAVLVSLNGGNVVNQTDGVTGCAFLAGIGDLETDDPQLAGLSSYGEPTPTALPLIGSPVLDRFASGCPGVDQRGVPRPQGPSCDAGAVELRPAIFTPTPTALVFPDQAVGGTSAGQDVTVTNDGDVAGTPGPGLGGADPSSFVLSGCADPVFHGFTCTLTVTFAPTSGGAKSAQVTGLATAVGLSGTVLGPPAPPSAGGPVPVCDDIDATTPFETPVRVTVRCSALVWRWEIVQAPEHGRLSPIDDRGRLVYTPDPGFSGFDVFRYRATGPGGASEPAIVRLAVGEGPPAAMPPTPPATAPLCARMPKLTGRTMKGVRRTLRRTACEDVPRTVSRRGKPGEKPRRVVRQRPKAGTVIAPGGRIVLVLRAQR